MGRVEVLAFAPGYGASPPVELDFAEGLEQEVVLLLREPIVGRGRVVHAHTAEPVHGAEVVLLASRHGSTLALAVQPEKTDPEGWFEVTGLVPEGNILGLSAPGFARRTEYFPPGAGPILDLGSLTLAPAQDLRVRLTGDLSADPGAYTVELTGATFQGPRPFQANGSALFEGVSHGSHLVRVRTPEGASVEVHVTLVSGATWHLDVEVDAQPTKGVEVIVEADSLPAEFAPEDTSVRVLTELDGKLTQRLYRLPESGRILLPAPLGETALVAWIAAGPRTLGMEWIRVAEHHSSPVRLRHQPGNRPVRVVDSRGEPVAQAHVRAFSPRFSHLWSWTESTNSEGRVFLSGLAIAPLEVWAVHVEHGVSPVLRIEGPADGREHVIEFRGLQHRVIEVLDGTQPLAGIVPWFETPSGQSLIGGAPTDAQGRTRTMPLPKEPLVVRILEPGFWPTLAPIDMGAADTQVTIQVRRLGALALKVVTAEGLALAGARIELTSHEFGESVARWLGEGRVSASDSQLVTDERGELRLFGLPNGPYRYTLTAPGAEPRLGTLQIPPHAQAQLELQVGD